MIGLNPFVAARRGSDLPVVVTGYDAAARTASGRAPAGAAVTVKVDGTAIGTATADAQGAWSHTIAGEVSGVLTASAEVTSSAFALPGLVTLIVTSQAALDAALAASVLVGTIKLRKSGGPYRIARDNVAALSKLTITSEVAADPATIEMIGKTAGGGAALAGWKRVTITGVRLDRTAVAYATAPQYVPNVWLAAPEAVEIVGNTFKGRATARWPGDTNPGAVVLGDKGIRMTSPKTCKVSGNTFDGYSSWLQSTGEGQDGNEVTGNTGARCQMDYVQVVGSGDGLVFRGNKFRSPLGSINEYQSDSGNHDDMLQISNTGATQPWRNVLVEDNDLISDGADPYQLVFVPNEAGLRHQGVTVRNNRLMTSQLNAIAVTDGDDVLVEDNTVAWSAVPTVADVQVPNNKPMINLPGSAGICRRNIAPAYTLPAGIAAAANVVLDYANVYGLAYAGRLLPGSLATDGSYDFALAKLPATYGAGCASMKTDPAHALPAARLPGADYASLTRELAADPAFAAAGNFVRVNVNVAGNKAGETHAQAYWGIAPTAGIAGPRTILVDVVVDDPSAGEFTVSAFSAPPTTGTLMTATDRVYQSARKSGAGHHVEPIAIPAGQTWWPAVVGIGGVASAVVLSRFDVFDLTVGATFDMTGATMDATNLTLDMAA